ncbi:MAG: hypothetical protein EAX96_05495 [Candidatus Lokiarchaeota archaeon]|nr:hypothetical protein [Candidatus Lokiarchaeota archaeon]
MDPRSTEDRITALFSNYTSAKNSCPYYAGGTKHQCEFDKLSRRVWDCKGICFQDGFTCNYIIQYQEQYEKLMEISIKQKINLQ